MSWYRQNRIHVSHDALTAFAWSAPMRDLAARVGMSDVGLKKVLRSHGIVTPPQGHWNRVHAGRAVPEPPKAPPRRPGETGRIDLDERFRGLVAQAPSIPVDGPFASPLVPEDLAELRAQELRVIGKVAVPRNLEKPNVGLEQLLKREAQRRLKVEAERWHWDEPVFDTPLDQRRLRLVNGLFNALAKRGHTGGASDHDGELSAYCEIGDMTLRLNLSIIGKHRTERFRGGSRPASDLPASTPLKLSLDRKLRMEIPTSWQDDDDGRLEVRMAAIAADLIVAGEASFRQSLIEAVEWEEQQRKWREECRQRRLAELEARRLEDLKSSGKLLSKAEEIRALVTRVKAAVSTGGADILSDDLARWERWALDYADRIDPVKSGQIFSHIYVSELD